MRHERDMLPIDEACKSIMPSLWDDYAKARDGARDILRMRELRFVPLSLLPDQKRRRDTYEEARATLTTRIRSNVKSNEFELWARLAGSLELQHIRPWTIDGLEIDYEKRTATGDGLPPLYDVHIRLSAADETDDTANPTPGLPVADLPAPPPAKNVSEAALRQCLLDIVEERPDDPPDEETLLGMLEKRLGASVARDRVRAARKNHAPHWVLPRGRPRKSAQ